MESLKFVDETAEYVSDGVEVEEKEKFEVKDISGANWVLRKLSELKKQDDEIKRLADEEFERINSWKDRELKANQGSREYLEGLLIKYYAAEREKDEKFKISTPYGKVSSRKQQPEVIYEDEKVIAWLKANDKPEFIRVKEEINKADLRKVMTITNGGMVDEDGQIIDGIRVEERPIKVVISIVE